MDISGRNLSLQEDIYRGLAEEHTNLAKLYSRSFPKTLKGFPGFRDDVNYRCLIRGATTVGQPSSVLIIVGVMTVLVPWIVHCTSFRIKKPFLWCVFLIYILGNMYFTLFSRTIDSRNILELVPFRTYYRIIKSAQSAALTVEWPSAIFVGAQDLIIGVLLNVLLYYPMGYLLSWLLLKRSQKAIILVGILASVSTEVFQYVFGLGWCTVDDVIHNTLGTAIGVWVWHLQSKRLNKPKSNELPKD